MTLEIRRGQLPVELLGVVQAEYNEKTGTAVIELSRVVDVHCLDPYTDDGCDNPHHAAILSRYFDAKDVKRYSQDKPRLEGTLVGQDGSADFVLYY